MARDVERPESYWQLRWVRLRIWSKRLYAGLYAGLLIFTSQTVPPVPPVGSQSSSAITRHQISLGIRYHSACFFVFFKDYARSTLSRGVAWCNNRGNSAGYRHRMAFCSGHCFWVRDPFCLQYSNMKTSTHYAMPSGALQLGMNTIYFQAGSSVESHLIGLASFSSAQLRKQESKSLPRSAGLQTCRDL
jgi:hypothetical protein